jgi:hypothetical protein
MFADLGLPPNLVPLVNIAFLAVMGAIAVMGFRGRDPDSGRSPIRLIFAATAAVFFILVLVQGVLGMFG